MPVNEKIKISRSDAALLCVAVLVLAVAYLFQRVSYAEYIPIPWGPNGIFIFNKTIRLVVNDLACMLIIYVLFKERRYLRISFYVFLFELGILLPVYFIVKLSIEGPTEISSPLLSQVHRLIVNPMLMVLLMFGFYYQRRKLAKTG